MIKGEVNAFNAAVIPLRVQASDGRVFEIEATIDTGFTGYVALPKEDIALLGLSFEQDELLVVGSGTLESFATYRGLVLWEGSWRSVSVLATDSGTLIGMKMLRGSRLIMTVIDGGAVTIEAAQ